MGRNETQYEAGWSVSAFVDPRMIEKEIKKKLQDDQEISKTLVVSRYLWASVKA